MTYYRRQRGALNFWATSTGKMAGWWLEEGDSGCVTDYTAGATQLGTSTWTSLYNPHFRPPTHRQTDSQSILLVSHWCDSSDPRVLSSYIPAAQYFDKLVTCQRYYYRLQTITC